MVWTRRSETCVRNELSRRLNILRSKHVAFREWAARQWKLCQLCSRQLISHFESPHDQSHIAGCGDWIRRRFGTALNQIDKVSADLWTWFVDRSTGRAEHGGTLSADCRRAGCFGGRRRRRPASDSDSTAQRFRLQSSGRTRKKNR